MQQQSVFKSLSDPTRRKILQLLKQRSMSAGEIAAHFDMSKASLSHHFNLLKQADLVRTERQGQHIIYSLNMTVFEDVAALMFQLFSGNTKNEK
ncbi:autorepressor SdpR family transcription factor [Idiomarina sp. HP20-50]|uniref:autorepressor SdpR family transcription factor n=1 Tax=Idiomarina sp. HP20-50 TaxID=3070813 RepID=UPI00294B2FE0|nr:autorepressor SdpR family transcription factor [Idiomarina sp. HP20-50]MDV6315303.1 autorepressor SdpR family transcription factor [Idiomarina sp. HP20-50]